MRLLLFLSVAAAALAGGPWVEVPAGGAPMLPADPLSVLRTNLSSGGAATTEIVAVDGMPFARAMCVTVKTMPSVPWGVQIMATTTGDIQAGDVLLLALFARGSAENNESGDAYAVAYLQDSRPPNTKLGSQPVNAGTEWRQFLLPFRVSMSLAQGQHNFTIHMGYYFQTLEVGGLSLLNYGASRTLAELPRTKPDYT